MWNEIAINHLQLRAQSVQLNKDQKECQVLFTPIHNVGSVEASSKLYLQVVLQEPFLYY